MLALNSLTVFHHSSYAWSQEAGAYCSWHWARGGLHPERVTSSDWLRETTTLSHLTGGYRDTKQTNQNTRPTLESAIRILSSAEMSAGAGTGRCCRRESETTWRKSDVELISHGATVNVWALSQQLTATKVSGRGAHQFTASDVDVLMIGVTAAACMQISSNKPLFQCKYAKSWTRV